MFSNFSRLEFVDITGQHRARAVALSSTLVSLGTMLKKPHTISQRTGLRLDGRRPEEVRQTSFSRVMVPGADGAVFLQQGGTHVLASVWGPREVQCCNAFRVQRCQQQG